MEEELNRTYIVLSAHAELHKYRVYCFTLVLTVYVLILCSNCTVVYLIWKQPDLHEPMYVFIAALLLNSVLFSTNIYPKLLLDFLSDTQVISHQACLLQNYMVYTSGSSEFLLLAAMSYDRYVSICRPLHYPSIMRRSTVCALLLSAWLVPAAQFVGLTVMISNQKLCSFSLRLIICNDSIYKLFCVPSRAISFFGVFTLFSNAVLPVLFIVFTYVRILIISYRSSRDVRRKAAHTCLSHLLVLSNFCFLGTFDVITARLDADFLTAHLIMILLLDLFNPLFNPIIYGLKMKEIHKYIKRSIR